MELRTAPWTPIAKGFQDGIHQSEDQGITFYSCYIAPSVHISEFRTIMQEIADDARGRSHILIAGDFNAWSTTWGSASTTQRRTILLEAVASLNVCLLNEGNRPTFSKIGRESIIDLTFASPELARNCVWRLSEIYTHSDHALIIAQTSPRLGRIPLTQCPS